MPMDYKLKHIVSLNPDLISNLRINLDVDGQDYRFRTFDVRSEIIELGDFFDYNTIKQAYGPIERKLKDFTYGKSFSDFSDYEVFKIKKSTFKVDIHGKQYELEITGVGPIALKVSLFLSFAKIDNEDDIFKRNLKSIILDRYDNVIEMNHDKLSQMKKEYNEREAKQEKIREEVKREQAEKERKRRELEEMLNRNKPKNNERPFKMY